jgi:xylulokinase
MSVLLGIDIGTQGTKAALYTLRGECLAEAFKHSILHRPAPGVVEEDPENQVESVLDTIRACMEKSVVGPAEVASVAIAGQMAGIIGVDAHGHAVTPYDSWLDTRCGPYIEKMQRVAGDEITEKTGNPPSLNHGPKKLWWKHERSEDYARIRAFVQPGAYAAMRLCGLDGSRAFIDNTYLEWFRRELQDNRFTFEELNSLASGVEDEAGLPYFVPHFGGCVSPPLAKCSRCLARTNVGHDARASVSRDA